MIFQDPASSLNPRQRAVDILTEPMHLCGLGQKSQRIEMARELLAQVGLSSSSLMLFPHQFSGGQRQRLVIARALATRPELVVADEPVSALDAAVQAQILNLLGSLRDNFGLTVLFISHDLGVVQHACHEVGVMYRGLLIERAPTEKLFSAPAHPYTWALLSASVTDWGLREALKTIFGSGLENGVAADPDQKEKAARKKSLTPNFETTQPVSSTRSITKSIKWAISGCLKESGGQILNPRLSEDGSEGCNFLQCPLAEEKCRTQEPVLTEFEPGHLSRCRLAAEIRRQGQAVLELASSPAFGQMTAAA
jgi:ABC-type dipeptide/oligopeptide/nickel transport system ATPase component